MSDKKKNPSMPTSGTKPPAMTIKGSVPKMETPPPPPPKIKDIK